MTDFIDRELPPILGAVTIHSPAEISFAGEPPVRIVPNPGEADPLARALRDLLYARCYARPFGTPAAVPPAPGADPGFPLRLSAANQGRDRWDAGWRIYQLQPDGQIAVQKGERCRTALAGEYATHAGPGVPPRVGSPASLLAPRESHQLQPGFYFAFGETLGDHFDDFQMVRFYFHTSADGAVELVRHLTAWLNRHEVPYRMKCLSDPAFYDRTDSAVLYVARRWFQIAAAAVADLPAAVADRLRPVAPLFSRPLRPGVGLAEDPGNGESFGMHRCRLLAEGLAEAWRRGGPGPLEAVRARFARAGLSLAALHLNPGSMDFDLGFDPERIAA
ncbi:MAG TPA: T3SS effector HopA1 family protein [Thermoanaerobaculia bacterium]|jgi:hypothetical protein